MKYLNLLVALRNDNTLMRASLEQIGAWFLLVSYCHDQMNGGMIVGCQEWPDSIWQRVANTTGAFMAQDSPLWHFSGVALFVHHYDQQAEDAYKRKQRMGKVYIERRWAAQRERKIIQMESKNSGKPQKDNAS